MKVQKGRMIPLGYGKYVRAESIVSIVPIEEGRGPGKRTQVSVKGLDAPIIASRSENAIIRDVTESRAEASVSREQLELLEDILDSVEEINPLVRNIIRDQGNWNLDRLEQRLKEALNRE